MRRKVVVGVIAGAVALVGAGCGGSDEPQTPRAQFVQQANSICRQMARDVNAELLRAVRLRRAGVSQQALARRYFAAIGTVQRRAVERLDGLHPPNRLRDSFEGMTGAMRAQLEFLPTAGGGRRDSQERPRRAQETRARDFARSAGLRACP